MKPPTCTSCRRPLRDPLSIARKLGPDCWAAEHPDLAPRRRMSAVSLPKPRPASGPMPNQEVIDFETLEG